MASDKATHRVTGAPSTVSTEPLSKWFSSLPPDEEQRYADMLAQSAADEREGEVWSAASDTIIGLGRTITPQTTIVHEVFTSDAIIPGI